MADTQTPQTPASVIPAGEKVTLEEMQKSLDALEGKTPAPPAPVEQKVETAPLKKTADAVSTSASPDLKKALEVSSALKEIVDLQGLHIDASLTEMKKSVDAAATRDLSFMKVLESMQKSIKELGEKVEKFGQTPTAPVAGAPTTKPEDILAKGAPSGVVTPPSTVQAEAAKINLTRGQVLTSLTKLAKSAPEGSGDAQAFTQALVKFESASKISDAMLAAVLKDVKAAA